MENDYIPQEIMDEIEAMCYLRPTNGGEDKKILARIEHWLQIYQIKRVSPIVINSYNKEIFLHDDGKAGWYYLVYDIHLLEAFIPFLGVYHRYGTKNLCGVIAFFLAEEMYIASNFQRASLLVDIFDAERLFFIPKEIAKSEEAWKKIESWLTYILDLSILHEIGHYMFLEKNENKALLHIYERVDGYVQELAGFDMFCRELKNKERMDVLVDILTNSNPGLYSQEEWSQYIENYISHGAQKDFPDRVTQKRYVEECCCDIFAVLQMMCLVEDDKERNELLQAFFWMIETRYFFNIIHGDKGTPVELWERSVDRINIVSACLRMIVQNDTIEEVVKEFFEDNNLYATYGIEYIIQLRETKEHGSVPVGDMEENMLQLRRHRWNKESM